MIKKNKISVIISSLMFIAPIYSQDYYVPQTYHSQIVESYPGVIVERRWVKYNEHVDNSSRTGTALGAVSGAAVGSAFGKGSGKIAGVLGGAVLGGMIGNSIGKDVHQHKGYYMFEYTIKLYDGRLMTVSQPPEVNYTVGQNVLFERSNDGRYFLLPQN